MLPTLASLLRQLCVSAGIAVVRVEPLRHSGGAAPEHGEVIAFQQAQRA
jgi:hypothetical protein